MARYDSHCVLLHAVTLIQQSLLGCLWPLVGYCKNSLCLSAGSLVESLIFLAKFTGSLRPCTCKCVSIDGEEQSTVLQCLQIWGPK